MEANKFIHNGERHVSLCFSINISIFIHVFRGFEIKKLFMHTNVFINTNVILIPLKA